MFYMNMDLYHYLLLALLTMLTLSQTRPIPQRGMTLLACRRPIRTEGVLFSSLFRDGREQLFPLGGETRCAIRGRMRQNVNGNAMGRLKSTRSLKTVLYGK